MAPRKAKCSNAAGDPVKCPKPKASRVRPATKADKSIYPVHSKYNLKQKTYFGQETSEPMMQQIAQVNHANSSLTEDLQRSANIDFSAAIAGQRDITNRISNMLFDNYADDARPLASHGYYERGPIKNIKGRGKDKIESFRVDSDAWRGEPIANFKQPKIIITRPKGAPRKSQAAATPEKEGIAFARKTTPKKKK